MVTRKSCPRHLFGTTQLVIVAGAFAIGCLDPKGDYNQFVDRTEQIRGRVPVDGGVAEETGNLPPIQGVAPTQAIKTPYLLECLPGLAGGDPRKALRFLVNLDYAPHGGGGGTISLNVRPLLASATDLSEIDPKGADATVASTEVGADGKFAGPLGTGHVLIPGTANSISGRDIVVEQSQLRGVFFDGDKMCSQLDGTATAPVTIKIDGTPCIAKRYEAASGALPTYQGNEASSFVCPM